jgi:hypothetical protein
MNLKLRLSCKEATARTDLADYAGVSDRIAYWLHMSICGACARYRDVSRALGEAIRGHAVSADEASLDAEKINEGLLKTFSKDL